MLTFGNLIQKAWSIPAKNCVPVKGIWCKSIDYRQRRIFRITVGEYIKNILKQRNMTQVDLVREINRLHLYKTNEIQRQKLNNFLNGIGGNNFLMARRCEIALNLPKYSLIKIMGEPTKAEWKKIMEVDKCID